MKEVIIDDLFGEKFRVQGVDLSLSIRDGMLWVEGEIDPLTEEVRREVLWAIPVDKVLQVRSGAALIEQWGPPATVDRLTRREPDVPPDWAKR